MLCNVVLRHASFSLSFVFRSSSFHSFPSLFLVAFLRRPSHWTFCSFLKALWFYSSFSSICGSFVIPLCSVFGFPSEFPRSSCETCLTHLPWTCSHAHTRTHTRTYMHTHALTYMHYLNVISDFTAMFILLIILYHQVLPRVNPIRVISNPFTLKILTNVSISLCFLCWHRPVVFKLLCLSC